jgi:hypothetical protein
LTFAGCGEYRLKIIRDVSGKRRRKDKLHVEGFSKIIL